MGSRETLVRVYIDALEGRAIYVHAALKGQSSRIGFEADSKYDLTAKLWFAKRSHAELVMMRCIDDLVATGCMRPHGWIDRKPAETLEKIKLTARMLGARWRTGTELKRDAEKVVFEIERRVEIARRAGDMSELNKRYKSYRLDTVAKGKKAISYGTYVECQMKRAVIKAAQEFSA